MWYPFIFLQKFWCLFIILGAWFPLQSIFCVNFNSAQNTRLSHTHKSRSSPMVSRIKTVFQWKENIRLKTQCKAQIPILGWIPSYNFCEILKNPRIFLPTATHTNTYLYICNTPIHESALNIKLIIPHKYWSIFRSKAHKVLINHDINHSTLLKNSVYF